jgi:hypothetical protein
MYTKDFTFLAGACQVHLSVNSDQSACYIYVNDIYNERLTMRFFTDMDSAIAWINSL